MQGRRGGCGVRHGFTERDVFDTVMSDESICVPFLERILGIGIDHVVKHQREKEVKQYAEAKGVWFDVYVKSSDKVIDLEMQCSRYPALGKRMRFYQSAIDTLELTEGMAYDELLESYVIFLCTYDPYGRGLARYDIEPLCVQDASVRAGADMHWVVLNSRAFDEAPSEGMRSLLEYVETGRVDERDPLVSAIAEKVAEVNGRSGGMFWSLEDEIELRTRYAKAEGEAEGEARGEARLSNLIKMLLGAGRSEDIERVASDAAYREQLFKEFGIA